jgi:arsenate reductase
MAEPRRVLFVCIGNTCRSQMAEGFALSYGAEDFEIKSAGTSAMGYVIEDTIEIMAEKDIDISAHTSDQFSPLLLDWADVVVTLGCASVDELCPSGFRGEKHDWPISDPLGMGTEFFRNVRDDIELRVKELLDANR